jgi:acetyltransferase-like isoleucine patch superfamily enzyme
MNKKYQLSKWTKLVCLATPNFLLRRIIHRLPGFEFFKNTRQTQVPITFDLWYNQKVLGHCRSAYFPVHKTSIVSNPNNIYCGIETSPGYSFGNYISPGDAKIYIGDYTQIAPNVGIIAANHDLHDNRQHVHKDVVIGKYCWIGFGAVILPGVTLGDYTIVGANAVVTKSFSEGFCVIGGNPARKIKDLQLELCVFHKSEHEYNGYIPNTDFEAYRKENLKV